MAEKIGDDLSFLTLSQLRTILKRLGIRYPKTADKDMLIQIILDEENYGAGNPYPFKYKDTGEVAAKILSQPFWKTPAGIDDRIESLAGHYTYQETNDMMRYQPIAVVLLWETIGDDKVCPICLDNEESGDYDLVYGTSYGENAYRPEGDVPEYPAHYGCRCQWAIIYEYSETAEP